MRGAPSASVENRTQAVAGFVLAGGESSRMGSDKALVDFGGQRLILRVLDILRGAGLDPVIAGSRSALGTYAAVVPDETQGRGPLSGVVAGLQGTKRQLCVYLTVDLPLLPSELITYLVHHAVLTGSTVTLASLNGYPQTFPAVVRREALPACEAELKTGQGGCFAAFRRAARERGEDASILPVESLAQAGAVSDPHDLPPVYWFLNVNSPQDLAHAREVFLRRAGKAITGWEDETDGRPQL